MKIGNTEFEIGKRTYVWGILNVTPDSFSDGGKFFDPQAAISHAAEMLREGADIIDVGGESTRPGHIPVTTDEEIKRILPIIKALVPDCGAPVSIDTYKASVAEAALKNGASVVNDIWGFKKDKDIARVCADYGAACCIMHNRESNAYRNIIEDILDDLKQSVDIALSAGVAQSQIIVDPGIGFAKDYAQNLCVLNNLEKFGGLGFPVLLGISRKSVIGTALTAEVSQRAEGTIALNVLGLLKGIDFIRVHDVAANKRACVMIDAVVRGQNG